MNFRLIQIIIDERLQLTVVDMVGLDSLLHFWYENQINAAQFFGNKKHHFIFQSTEDNRMIFTRKKSSSNEAVFRSTKCFLQQKTFCYPIA